MSNKVITVRKHDERLVVDGIVMSKFVTTMLLTEQELYIKSFIHMTLMYSS